MAAANKNSLRSAIEDCLSDLSNKENCEKLLKLLETEFPNGIKPVTRVPMGYYLAGECARNLGDEKRALCYFMIAVGKGQAGESVYRYLAQQMKNFNTERAVALENISSRLRPEQDMLARRFSNTTQSKRQR